MKLKYWLLCSSTFLKAYYICGHCIDIHSNIVSQGLHYVPGTNPCTLCICDKGSPKWCKSVLCSPPQNCKSFQVGNSCCEFKCLDDILSGHDSYKESYDVALRFVASTVTAIVSVLILAFLYNRLKRNHLHNHQRDDQRNVGNVGYITGNFGYTQHNLGYLSAGNNELEIRYEETSTNFSLWKPPGNYFPGGEAPPPYEEAMRSAQTEIVSNQMNINTTTHNTLMNSFSSGYAQEIHPPVICRHEDITASTVSNNTNHYVNVRAQNTGQINKKNEHKDKQEVSYENIKALKAAINEVNRPTSSGLNKLAYHKSRNREQEMGCLGKYESNESSRHSAEHSSYRIKVSEPYEIAIKSIRGEQQRKTHHRTLPKNLRELLSNGDKPDLYKMQVYDIPVVSTSSSLPKPESTNASSTATSYLTEPKNIVSYQSLSQDEEDYRSECENCKSIVSANDEEGEALNETMSLQRRPLSENGFEICYRTSLTLPTNSKKQRSYPNPSNREKWFSSMQQQSSSEESD